MKRYLAIIGILLLIAIQAQAGPPITQGINLAAPGAIGATTPGTGTFTSVSIGGESYVSYAGAVADEDTLTLPTISAGYTGRGIVRFTTTGSTTVTDSTEFEAGSGGITATPNPDNIIRSTANVVYGASCADVKICIGTASGQNPIQLKFRNGTGTAQYEFWYH